MCWSFCFEGVCGRGFIDHVTQSQLINYTKYCCVCTSLYIFVLPVFQCPCSITSVHFWKYLNTEWKCVTTNELTESDMPPFYVVPQWRPSVSLRVAGCLCHLRWRHRVAWVTQRAGSRRGRRRARRRWAWSAGVSAVRWSCCRALADSPCPDQERII